MFLSKKSYERLSDVLTDFFFLSSRTDQLLLFDLPKTPRLCLAAGPTRTDSPRTSHLRRLANIRTAAAATATTTAAAAAATAATAKPARTCQPT